MKVKYIYIFLIGMVLGCKTNYELENKFKNIGYSFKKVEEISLKKNMYKIGETKIFLNKKIDSIKIIKKEYSQNDVEYYYDSESVKFVYREITSSKNELESNIREERELQDKMHNNYEVLKISNNIFIVSMYFEAEGEYITGASIYDKNKYYILDYYSYEKDKREKFMELLVIYIYNNFILE